MSICDMSYSVHLRNLPVPCVHRWLQILKYCNYLWSLIKSLPFSTFSPQLGQNLSVDERSPPHFKQLLLSSLVPQKLQKFCLSCTGAEQLMQTLKQKVLGMGSHESILPCSQQQFFTTMTSFKWSDTKQTRTCIPEVVDKTFLSRLIL